MIDPARYFSRETYTSMPWRNGAGVTREIAREPAQGESFAWRLSLAALQVSGPFSSYVGYQRCIALVEGHGFRPHVAGAEEKILSARGEHAFFAGAAETRCELLDGPCTDLSLMVRDPGTIYSATRLDIIAEQSMKIASGNLQVLFVLHGAINCHVTGSSESRARPYRLNLHDTLLIHGRIHSWSISQTSGEAAEVFVVSFTSV